MELSTILNDTDKPAANTMVSGGAYVMTWRDRQ